MVSDCHNAEIKEVDGKKVCSVCDNECKAVAGGASSSTEGSATGGTAPAPKPGESWEGVCVPRTTEAAMPKVGDTCEIEGKQGTFQEREGSLVCVPNEETV